MDKQQFVNALRLHAATMGADSTLRQWEAPAGRSPGQLALDRSRWFTGLADDDRAMVAALAHDAADAALFGVLCILDGARRVDPSNNVRYELARIKDGGTTHLLASTSIDTENLHDLI
jgi:hypothetical protein